jgi:hypothetical protein
MITIGCATNPYSKFYYDTLHGRSISEFPNFETDRGEPKVYSGSNPELDYQTMMEDGYTLIGFSSFNAKE